MSGVPVLLGGIQPGAAVWLAEQHTGSQSSPWGCQTLLNACCSCGLAVQGVCVHTPQRALQPQPRGGHAHSHQGGRPGGGARAAVLAVSAPAELGASEQAQRRLNGPTAAEHTYSGGFDPSEALCAWPFDKLNLHRSQ